MDKRKSPRNAQKNVAVAASTAASVGLRASVVAGQIGFTSDSAEQWMENLGVRQSSNVHGLGIGESWATKELACAREFNFDLSPNLEANCWRLEQAVCTLMDAEHCVILYFDESSGQYFNLSEFTQPSHQPVGLLNVEEDCLKQVLQSQKSVLQSHLVLENGDFIGLIAISSKAETCSAFSSDKCMVCVSGPGRALKRGGGGNCVV